MANPNLFAQYARPAKSVMDYMTEMEDADAARSRNALQALLIGNQTEKIGYERQDRARADATRNKIAALVNQFGGNNDALIGAAERDPDLIGWADARKAAELKRRKEAADAAKTEGETVESRAKLYRGLIGRVGSYDGAVSWVRAQYEDPIIGPIVSKAMPIEAALGEIPRDPQGLRQWQMREGMDLDKFIAATAPKFTAAGDRLVNTNPDAVAQQIPIRQSPDNAATQATTRRGQDMTDARVRERLDYERGNAVADAGGPGQADLVKRFGKPPKDFRWKADGSAEAIPGGPADIKAGEQGAKAEARKQALSTTADSVLDTISEAKKLIGYTTTGAGGLAASIPMTDARTLAGKIKTIQGNLSFDRLQQMRDMSPTGGALGQVAVQELEMLKSTVAMLDQLQRPQDVRSALDKIERHYSRWKETLGGSSGGADASFAGPPPGVDPRLWDAMTPQEKSLWKK